MQCHPLISNGPNHLGIMAGFEFVDAGMRQLTSQTAFEEGEEGMKDWCGDWGH